MEGMEYRGFFVVNRAVDDYIVLDFETTGLSPYTDEIIEIGAVRVNGCVVTAEFHSMIKPNVKVGKWARMTNNISDAELDAAPSHAEVLPKLLDFIGDLPIVAHNANFELNMLTQHIKRFLPDSPSMDNIFIDTMAFMRSHRELSNNKGAGLKDSLAYFDITNDNAHRALSDVYATQQLYERLKPYVFNSTCLSYIPIFKNCSSECVFEKIVSMVNGSSERFSLKNNKANSTISFCGAVALQITVNSRTQAIRIDPKYNDIALGYMSSIPDSYIQSDRLNIPLLISQEYAPIVQELFQRIYDTSQKNITGNSFACCSDFMACSDARQCIHKDDDDLANCYYRKNLEAGRIFYGKNKNSD